MDPVEKAQLDVQDYVQDLVDGRLGVEAFCAAMRVVHEEQSAVQALLERANANTQVVSALRRLTAGDSGPTGTRARTR